MEAGSFKRVEVVPYKAEWARIFDEEKKILKHALQDNCIDIYHVGSTSVPGLIAKDSVDILCVVRNLASSMKLQYIGYTFKGEINVPLRYFFSKNSSHSKMHLHVVEQGNGFIGSKLCFRDYLRAHQDARLAYAALKSKLLQDSVSQQKVGAKLSNYTLGKDQFIKEALGRAGLLLAIACTLMSGKAIIEFVKSRSSMTSMCNTIGTIRVFLTQIAITLCCIAART